MIALKRVQLLLIGNTWTFEILTMLLKGKAEGSGRTHYLFPLLEASPAESMNVLPSPRLLNTHLPYNQLVTFFQLVVDRTVSYLAEGLLLIS